MYTLYHNPFSQHARRVAALLEEAGLDYELRHVALDDGEHMSPSYLAINPNGQVPTLLDGNVKIHESNAILRYLCLKNELKNWYPDDLRSWAVVEQWLDWNQCRLSPAVVDIVLNTVFMGDKGDAAAIKRGMEKLAELVPLLESGLADRDFLAGATPTIADLSVGANISHLALADATPNQSNIKNWYRRVCGIEGFQKTLPPA